MSQLATLINAEEVCRAYSGKPGCCGASDSVSIDCYECGCRGRHYWRYQQDYRIGGTHNDLRQIKRIVGFINEAIADGKPVDYDGQYVVYKTPIRVYIAYLQG
jgi:hypothetical protein